MREYILISYLAFHAFSLPRNTQTHPKQALVIVEIKYNPPDDCASSGNRRATSEDVYRNDSKHDDKTMQSEITEQQSFDDDQQMLLDIQQNIKSLERTINNKGKSGNKFKF